MLYRAYVGGEAIFKKKNCPRQDAIADFRPLRGFFETRIEGETQARKVT